MKTRRLQLTIAVLVGLGESTICLGGNRPQPSAPAIPPSWRQPAAPPKTPPPQTTQQPQQDPTPNDGTPRTGKQSKSGERRSSDRRYNNASPYGYGQPITGVYYPDGSGGVTSASGNPNAIRQNNQNNNNNNFGNGPDAPAPAADSKPTPAPVAPAPPTSPDPELIQANGDVNAAMNLLRDALLKTNADYQAAVADKKAAQADSATVHAKEDSTPEQILAAATRVLNASARVGQMQRDAAVTDPTVQDAQSKLKTALANHAFNAANVAAAK